MKQNIHFAMLLLLSSFSTIAQMETADKTVSMPTSPWSAFLTSTNGMFLDMENQSSEFSSNVAKFNLTESNIVTQIHPNQFVMAYSSGPNLGVGFEIRFKEGIKSRDVNISYRSGFQYRNRNVLQQDYSKSISSFYDSTFVPSLNTTVWRDSVFHSLYSANLSQESLLWNNSVLFRIAENKRLSFYSGIQIGLQFNFSRKFNLSQENYSFLDTYVSNAAIPNRVYTTTDKPDNTSSQEIKLDKTMNYHISIPVGLDFRFTNKRFWNRFHVYGEGTLGISGAKNLTRFNFNQNFGLRYKFYRKKNPSIN